MEELGRILIGDIMKDNRSIAVYCPECEHVTIIFRRGSRPECEKCRKPFTVLLDAENNIQCFVKESLKK